MLYLSSLGLCAPSVLGADVQDTPGLNYCQPNTQILDHITAKNAAYLACEQDFQRRVPMSAVEDMRVDACLFFINPNSLKAEEVAAMARLAELVPIVPMIAKVGRRRKARITKNHIGSRTACPVCDWSVVGW